MEKNLVLQDMKNILKKIELIRSNPDFEQLLQEYGIDASLLTEEQLNEEIVRKMMSETELQYYLEYVEYRKRKDFQGIMDSMDSLNTLTQQIEEIYGKRKDGRKNINAANDEKRNVLVALHQIPNIMIGTNFRSLEDKYNKLNRRFIKKGMDQYDFKEKIEHILYSNVIIRGLKSKKLKQLREELASYQEITDSELKELTAIYCQAYSDYLEFIKKVIRDLLRNRTIANACMLTCSLKYGDNVQLRTNYQGLQEITTYEIKPEEKDMVVKRVFEFFKTKDIDDLDEETFTKLFSEFCTYYYDIEIARLERQDETYLSEIKEVFFAQKGIIGNMEVCKRAIVLDEEENLDEEKQQIFSLVYSTDTTKKMK